MSIESGQIVGVAHPFIWDKATVFDGDSPKEVDTWRPGVRFCTELDRYGEPVEIAVADGVGKQILAVISTHKPGRYPERVFYTREWEDPDGKRFGKPGLRITTAQAFRRLVAGYRHEFEVA